MIFRDSHLMIRAMRNSATQYGMFSADEAANVRIDLARPVVEAIGSERKSRFGGRIPKVTVDVVNPTPMQTPSI